MDYSEKLQQNTIFKNAFQINHDNTAVPAIVPRNRNLPKKRHFWDFGQVNIKKS